MDFFVGLFVGIFVGGSASLLGVALCEKKSKRGTNHGNN